MKKSKQMVGSIENRIENLKNELQYPGDKVKIRVRIAELEKLLEHFRDQGLIK